jgi:hypothetical protein
VRFLLREWQARSAGLKAMGRRAGILNGSESLSSCQGGAFPNDGFNGFCAGESVGVLCRTCTTRHYFDSAKQRCKECPSVARTIESKRALLVTAVVLLIGLYPLYHYAKRPQKEFSCIDAALSILSRQLRRVVLAFRMGTFMAQLKLFVTFSQLAMAMPKVCNTRVPPIFYDVAFPFKACDLERYMPVNKACLGTSAGQLLTYGLAPLLLSALLLIPVMTFKYLHRDLANCFGSAKPSDRHASLVSVFLSIVPASLFILFLCATTVSDKIFDVFDCVEVETDSLQVVAQTRRFMRSQLDVECDQSNPEYSRLWNISMALLFVWPVGMPVVFMLSMLPARHDLHLGRQTRGTTVTAILHKEYKPMFFFFEARSPTKRAAPLPSTLALKRSLFDARSSSQWQCFIA